MDEAKSRQKARGAGRAARRKLRNPDTENDDARRQQAESSASTSASGQDLVILGAGDHRLAASTPSLH